MCWWTNGAAGKVNHWQVGRRALACFTQECSQFALSELRENDTASLVRDFEAVRRHLGIDRWLVFGGSWGSTLSLNYAVGPYCLYMEMSSVELCRHDGKPPCVIVELTAQMQAAALTFPLYTRCVQMNHPDRVTELVLRGIFLLREKELKWFYQGPGANFLFPEAWEEYVRVIPENERGDMIAAYAKRLRGDYGRKGLYICGGGGGIGFHDRTFGVVAVLALWCRGTVTTVADCVFDGANGVHII